MDLRAPAVTPADGVDAASWRAQIAEGVHRPARLAAVAASDLVDSEPEAVFERLTRLAASLFDVPWAFVTVVDAQRSYWKSCFGVDAVGPAARQTPVDASFCQYVVATGEALLIEDVRVDRRTADNPAIASMGVVAWAGYPLLTLEGEVLGTFCVVDSAPRRWSEDDAAKLETLAGAAASEIGLRSALRRASVSTEELVLRLRQHDEMSRRSELKAELAQDLSAADTAEAVCRIAASTGRGVFDAEFVSVALLEPAGRRLRIVHSPSVPDDVVTRYATLPLSDQTPPGSAALNGRAVYASTFAQYAQQWPEVAADADALGVQATFALPLFRSDGSTIGALSVGWSSEVDFDVPLRAALRTVAQMCASAIERAQTGDIRHALIRMLQRELLPEVPPLAQLEVATRYVPAVDEVGFGGDWYDVVAISSSVTAIIVGDVCGHGISAAATMAQLRGTINALVRLHPDRLGDVFEIAGSWRSGPGDFIATIAVHLIDTASGTVSYLSAGHPPAVLVHPDGGTELLLDGRRPVFGVTGPLVTPGRTAFPVGSVLVAYTDGLIERRGVPLDTGLRELTDVVARTAALPVETIAHALTGWMPANPADDIAFAVVRRTADARGPVSGT